MRNLTLYLMLLLAVGSTAIGADDQGIESKVGLRARTFKVGDVWYILPPPELPSTAEVLRAISEDKVVRKNPRINCELILNKLGPPREYPLIGQGRMQTIHFKCTVDSDQGSETVYIDHDRLLPVLDFPTSGEILRALPDDGAVRHNPRFRCELIVHQVEPPRDYPLVGPARMIKSHFKCTVVSDRGQDVVYLDRDHLVPVK